MYTIHFAYYAHPCAIHQTRQNNTLYCRHKGKYQKQKYIVHRCMHIELNIITMSKHLKTFFYIAKHFIVIKIKMRNSLKMKHKC